MFVMTPFVFKNAYQSMARASPTASYFDADTGLTMAAYGLEIKEFFADAGFVGTPCAGKSIPSLGYAVAGQEPTVPGPLIFSAMGQQDLMRFTNKVSPTSTYFPPGGPKNSGHGTDGDICKNRPNRVVNATAGTGRGFSVHHHGMASLPAFDGWADQYFCHGETKDYVLPNNRHATQYYHDHALGITSENAYNGLIGMRITRPCAGDDPFKIEALEQHELLLSDMSLAAPDRSGKCRRLYNRLDEHEDNLFGDINMVNGVPWPVMSVKAKHHRFRVLNSAPSRPYIIQVRDDYGKEVGSQVCHIVGADGGVVPRPIALPSGGLMTDVAYRWDIVCDFSGYSNRTLYLYNQPDSSRTTSETPFFCYSHLIMKIKVGESAADPVTPKLQFGPEDGVLETNVALSSSYLAELMERALAGKFDRSLKFGHSSGIWQLNDKGWEDDETHIDFDNVGQNNVELWSLESGGGWIHPVHIHMIDGFCVAIKEDGGALKPCAPELFNVPKDVIHIGANVRQIIFAARYGPHLGNYMMHCHNVVHEDHDMLRAFLVVNATKGLTFSDTPEFQHELLAASSGQPEQYRADSQSTTYDAAHLAEYPLGADYLKKCIQKNYYQIFYPPKLVNDQPNPLRKRENNMWLTTCGIQEAPQETAPENPGGDPGVSQNVLGRRLLRK
jgi:FtsP/CotA-like multicopper oxidase with cupredoxin domain